MIVYEVALDVRPDLEAAVVAYFRDRHLPDMFDTGCFRAIDFERLGPGQLRSRYQCDDQADLDRYLADHAASMRDDFARHFPDGATPSRTVWEILQSWG